ncbi:MAG: hypothetical protein AMXMBFR64_50810 [Myxococcales bacterium]
MGRPSSKKADAPCEIPPCQRLPCLEGAPPTKGPAAACCAPGSPVVPVVVGAKDPNPRRPRAASKGRPAPIRVAADWATRASRPRAPAALPAPAKRAIERAAGVR